MTYSQNSSSSAEESQKEQPNQKLLLVDGLSILFRSFYAMPSMINIHGQNIGGVHGFIRQLLSMLYNKKPTHMVVAFDTGKPTWRHEKSNIYKANRKPSPIELYHQFQWARDVCNSITVPCVDFMSYEADDVIASYVRRYSGTMDIEIVSGDKDLMQLIKNNVVLYNTFEKRYTDSKAVVQKWGVRPSQIGDMLALIGDTADGIKGITGVGPKTAAKWLQKYDSIDNILQNLDFLTPSRLANNIRREYDELLLARELIQLNTMLNVPCIGSPYAYDIGRIDEFCIDYGLKNVYSMRYL